jgi:D-alanyl-D-alanine carboxypeptidase (penicillin-binding protein 5/6)
MKHRCFIKRTICTLLALMMSAAVLILPAAAAEEVNAPPEIENLSGAYLCNIENDVTLIEYNVDEVIYPTSAVKLMTAILSLEALSDRMDDELTVTADMLSDCYGNNRGLEEGETVTVRDMLYALIIGGANDAAYVLAYTVAGSATEFVSLMNVKAVKLGAYNTNYTNPTGMHNDQMVTTVSDTAIIAKYAYNLPLFTEISGTSKYVMEETNKSDYRNIYNRNCLVSMYYDSSYYFDGAVGMNAGSTTTGGHCVIAAAKTEDGELTYLSVAMGGDTVDGKITSYTNTINMLQWAMDTYSYVEVLSTSEMVTEIPVRLSSTVDYTALVPSEPVRVFLSNDVDVATAVEYSWSTYSDELTAPVTAGDVVGTVTATMDGKTLGRADLVVMNDVSRSEFLYMLDQIKEFTKSRFFIATVVAVAVLSIAYVFGNAILRERRLKRRTRY